MDLLTQGVLGGVVAQSGATREQSRLAALVGFGAALLADADVFIASSRDPLLNIEFHRHFSHSLIFIPVGALLASLLLWPLLRRRLEFRRIYLYALLGYATSGLLDACTSYGTHLLWPFSDTRFAWSIIAIVDPLFTLILLAALVWGLRSLTPRAARIGLGCAGLYLLLGTWQHHNALQLANELAAERGHPVDRILVKPTIGNLVLWRSVYESNGQFFVDGVRVGLSAERIYPGDNTPVFKPSSNPAGLAPDSVPAADIERFARLSDGFLARDPTRDGVLTDIRYSMLPTTITPMWGLDLKVSADEHARFELYRDRPDDYRERFIAMLLGRDLPD